MKGIETGKSVTKLIIVSEGTQMAIRNLLNSDKSEEFRQSNFGQSNYHSSRWKEIRSAQLHRQSLCEMCMKEGRYIATTLVHHSQIHATNNFSVKHGTGSRKMSEKENDHV